MSFFIHKITVFHFVGGIQSKLDFENVYFRHNKRINVTGGGVEIGSSGSITIPTNKTIDINTGDYVIEGIIDEEFNLEALMKKYPVYKVTSVADNRRGSLQHYKIEVAG